MLAASTKKKIPKDSIYGADMRNPKEILTKIWIDPVWSKVISAIIIAIGAAILASVGGLLPDPNLLQILAVPVQLWVIPIILILTVVAYGAWRYVKRPKYIWVRMDDISPGMKRHSVSYPVDAFNTVNQLIDRLTYDEDLGEFEIGKDWEIATPRGYEWITQRSGKKLKDFGIVPGSEVEIVLRLSQGTQERFHNRPRREEMRVLE